MIIEYYKQYKFIEQASDGRYIKKWSLKVGIDNCVDSNKASLRTTNTLDIIKYTNHHLILRFPVAALIQNRML